MRSATPNWCTLNPPARAEQLSPRHPGECSGSFSRVHRIEEQHARGSETYGNQFEAECAAVENRHARGTRGSACSNRAAWTPTPSSERIVLPTPMTTVSEESKSRIILSASVAHDADPSTRIDHVDGAGQTRVEGMNGAQNLQGTLRIRDGRFQERRFVRAALTVGISRAGIPCGGHHGLIILDRLVFDLHPVAQRPARSLKETESSGGLRARSSGPTFARCECAGFPSICCFPVPRSIPPGDLARSCVSSARAAIRPRVENRAVGGAFSFASVESTSVLTSGWPEAYATRNRASGPTSMALS